MCLSSSTIQLCLSFWTYHYHKLNFSLLLWALPLYFSLCQAYLSFETEKWAIGSLHSSFHCCSKTSPSSWLTVDLIYCEFRFLVNWNFRVFVRIKNSYGWFIFVLKVIRKIPRVTVSGILFLLLILLQNPMVAIFSFWEFWTNLLPKKTVLHLFSQSDFPHLTPYHAFSLRTQYSSCKSISPNFLIARWDHANSILNLDFSFLYQFLCWNPQAHTLLWFTRLIVILPLSLLFSIYFKVDWKKCLPARNLHP